MNPPPASLFTLGVEEEYQLVDADTGALRSRARFVIADDWSGEIKPEMQENTVEVETRICADSASLREELMRLRLQAAIAAEARGLRVVAAGTHPFSGWTGQEFTEGEIYRAIRAEYRRLAESQNIFGMHVHVGVPPGVDRVRVINVARLYLPHLLALTTSSPFFQGSDTGYASYRSILWRRWPRSGPPPPFRDVAEREMLLHWLTETGCIDGPGRLYWEIRAHHRYPTIEFRVCDVTPRLEDAVVVAALTRAIVIGVVEGALDGSDLPGTVLETLLRENGWRASRDGLGAELVDLHAGEPSVVPVREALTVLAERLRGILERAGDGETPERLAELLRRGDAAQRTRARAAEHGGDLTEVVRWLAEETVLGVGLDRRSQQREAVDE